MSEKYDILIIADSTEAIFPIKEKLKGSDLKLGVDLFKNHINFDSILTKKRWDLILSDYQTWKLFGRELLNLLKKKELTSPYIVIGKDIDESEMELLVESGVKDYINEDNLKHLIHTIRRELKNSVKINKLRNFPISPTLHEKEFQILLEISNCMIYKLDLNANFLEINNVFTSFLGYNQQETLDTLNVYKLIHPDDKTAFTDAINKVLDGKFVKNAEYRFKKKNGTYLQLSTNLGPINHENNKVIGFLCVSKDLTEYKTTQKFIENRIHRQEMIAQFGLEAITEKNIDKLFNKATTLLSEILDVEYTKILELHPNKKFLKLRAGIGWQEGLVGKATVENNKNSQAGFTLLKTNPVIVENLKTETRFEAPKLLADHDVISGMSVIIPGKNAPFGILGAHTKAYRIFSKDDINFLQSIANILADVIFRNSTEKELRESEEKYRMLTEQSLLGTLIIADDQIIFANKGVSDILGFSIDELLSWDINKIIQHIHPDDLKKTFDKYNKILNKKITSMQSEIRMKKKDNKYIYTRQYLKGIEFQGRSTLHINIIDITEQKKNESLLESSLQEKEILLKEIHHRVKNNLQVISSLIVLQEQYIKDEKILHMFKDFQNRIKAMALIHQTLYNSEKLNKIDLSKYIQGLVSNLLKAYSVNPNKINLQQNIEEVDLSLDEAMSCGLIINELVSNSLKHAFSKDGEGKIVVILNKTINNKILLDVHDNGVGFPKNMDYKSSNTLGLRLISTLTKQLGGDILIEKDNGAHVRITW